MVKVPLFVESVSPSKPPPIDASLMAERVLEDKSVPIDAVKARTEAWVFSGDVCCVSIQNMKVRLM